MKVIDDTFSLQSAYTTFSENEFSEYKKDHSQRLLDNFFEIAMGGITAAFIFRVIILSSQNAILDLILPFIIFMFIALAYYINKSTTQMKHYFHMIVIPIVGLLTARKTISQNKTQFFLNESFASWLIMMIFGGFSSTQQWYMVVAINLACFFVYFTIIFRFYGISAIGNDFYVHITTTIIFSTTLIRMNEVNLRNSFNLLSTSKIQERKWQRVLTMLTDGVLIMQHTENDKGILLINPSLQNILGNKQMTASEAGNNFEHTCEQKNSLKDDKATPKTISEISPKNSAPNTFSQQRVGEQKQANLQDNFDNASQNKQNQYFTLNDNIIQQPEQKINEIQENDFPIISNANCKACLQENQKYDSKKLLKKDNTLGKRRFNEKRVGPIFDEIFKDIRFKIIFQSSPLNGEIARHSTDPQFLNDFICKQMEYFKTNLPSGYSERLFLKVLNPRAVIELHMIKLDDDSQVLFLFKEVSVYNKLSKAKTTEKISNILINSIAHNLFTPLNVLIQLNKSMSDLIPIQNDLAQKNVQMIGVCLQQLVFTTHNILEMSKIRQGRFKSSSKEICVIEKLDQIFDYFKDDMKFREIDFQIKQQDKLKQFKIILDDARFVILLYNIVSNSVKHTNGGHIKVNMKLLTEEQAEKKKEKYAQIKQELQMKLQNEWASNQTQEGLEQSSDESQVQSVPGAFTTERRVFESSDAESGEKNSKKNILEEADEKVYLSVSVSDTGVGMNEEMRRKCFTLFGNLKFKKDVNQGGIGLGLASSSLICKALQGQVNLVRSQINEGSKFNFIIQVVLGKEIGDTSEDSQSDSIVSKYNDEHQNNQNYQSSNEEKNQDENDFEEGEASQTETIDSELIEKIQAENSEEQQQNEIQIDKNTTSEKDNDEYDESEEESIEGEEGEEGEEEQSEIEEAIDKRSSNNIVNMTSTSQIIKESQSQQDIADGFKQEFFKLKTQAIINTLSLKGSPQNNIKNTFQKMKIQDESNLLLQSNLQKVQKSIQKSNHKFSEVNEDSFERFLNDSQSMNQLHFKGGSLMAKEDLNNIRNSIPLTQMLNLHNKNLNKNEQQQVFFIPSFNKHQNKQNQEQPRILRKQSLLESYNQQIKKTNQDNNHQKKGSEILRFQILAGSQAELNSSNSTHKDLQEFQQQIVHNNAKNIQQNLEQNNNITQEIDQTDQDIKELSNELNQFQGNVDVKFRMSGENDLSEIHNQKSLLNNSQNQNKNLNISNNYSKKRKIFTQAMVKELFSNKALQSKCKSKEQSIFSGQKITEDSKSKNEQSSKSISLNQALQGLDHFKLVQQMKMISKAIISEYEKESTISRVLTNPPQIMQDSFIDDCDQDSEGANDCLERKKINKDPKIKGFMNQQQYEEFLQNSKTISLKVKEKESVDQLQNFNPPNSSFLPKLKRKSKQYNDIMTDDSIKKTEEIEQAQIITEKSNIKVDFGGSVYAQSDFALEEINNQRKDPNSQEKFNKLQIHTSVNSQKLPSKSKKKRMSFFQKNEKKVDYKSSQFYKMQQTSLERKDSDYSSKASEMKISRKQSSKKLQVSRMESKSQVHQQEKASSDKLSQISNLKKINYSAKAQLREHGYATGSTPSSGHDYRQKSPISDRQDVEDLSPVLIVDDTVFNIKILQMIFQSKYKITADQAVSGEEALMKCQQRMQRNQESYKLIVMDINMPGMDGVVTTTKIRQFNDAYVKKRQQKDYMIVAHTAIPEDQFGNCQEKGFDAFMQKPIDHEQLEKYLKKVRLN